MDVPASMMAQAKTFCAMQPCTRFAEGDLTVEQDGRKSVFSICARHHEYIMRYYGQQDFDPTIVGREVVFVDDVGDDEMIDQIVKYGNLQEIVR